MENGKEIWKFASENTFLKSHKRNSIIIKDNKVFFNNSLGDIVAISASDGSLLWQTPTQSSSNNRNEFFSVNLKNGILNWKQEINSKIRPLFYNEFIFTISKEGYFFVIENKTGNIIRITDIFSKFDTKKRYKIEPVGFIAGIKKLMVTTNNGRLLKIDIESGKTEEILKIADNQISRPFVFNKKIIMVKNNSIVRLN